MRILIVDDEFVSLKKLSLLLDDIGSCDTASSGEEALEMFITAEQENNPYELITLDIDMPGMSGTETVAKIRSYEEEMGIASLHTSVKVLMVTAMGDGKNIIGSFKGGCEGYLKKPFTRASIEKGLVDFVYYPCSTKCKTTFVLSWF